MQALGLIETKGLLAAIESADVMLKTASVELVEKTLVGGGLVTVAVTGDVGAVKAAVESGAAAVRQLDESLLVSQHVIPRPHQELDGLIVNLPKPPSSVAEITQGTTVPQQSEPIQSAEAFEELVEEEQHRSERSVEVPIQTVDFEQLHKPEIEAVVRQNGVEAALELLRQLRVVKLRNLAREYPDLGFSGRLISKADKEKLLTEFRRYYMQKEQDMASNQTIQSEE